MGKLYVRGGESHTWSNTSGKEKVGLSAGPICEGGLVGGEIRYIMRSSGQETKHW